MPTASQTGKVATATLFGLLLGGLIGFSQDPVAGVALTALLGGGFAFLQAGGFSFRRSAASSQEPSNPWAAPFGWTLAMLLGLLASTTVRVETSRSRSPALVIVLSRTDPMDSLFVAKISAACRADRLGLDDRNGTDLGSAIVAIRKRSSLFELDEALTEILKSPAPPRPEGFSIRGRSKE